MALKYFLGGYSNYLWVEKLRRQGQKNNSIFDKELDHVNS